MTLKWGSTTVTAVKWGSTTCTAVYWGSTKVWPDTPFAVLSVAYVGLQYRYSSRKYWIRQGTYMNTQNGTSGGTEMAHVTGKEISSKHTKSGSSTHYRGYAMLITSQAMSCSGTKTVTLNVTSATGTSTYPNTAKLVYMSSLPSTQTEVTTDMWGGFSGQSLSVYETGTKTINMSISGTYYLGVYVMSGDYGPVTATVTNFT